MRVLTAFSFPSAIRRASERFQTSCRSQATGSTAEGSGRTDLPGHPGDGFRKDATKLLGPEWLGQKVVHAALQTTDAVTVHGMGRHGDNGNSARWDCPVRVAESIRSPQSRSFRAFRGP